MTVRRVAPVLLLAVLGCSSHVAPRSDVTLLVINDSCQAGHCDSLDVLAFPSNQPHTPGGLWSIKLGRVTTPQACFSFAASAHFYVIGPTADTIKYLWTSADPLSLGALRPPGNPLMAGPSTATFVPAAADGWTVSLPSGAQATPAATCTR